MTKQAATRRKHKNREPVRTINAERTVTARFFLFLVLGGLLVAGVVTRVQFLDRSLWLDEAWVANSIQAASLHQAIYYDDWLQTTPPLFIALSRLITALFGTSNVALRALPAFSGIVSVLFFSFLALKLLRPSFALIAVLLFVFSPRVILYSQSLKQYSTDVFSTISLLVLGTIYLKRRSDRWFYVLLAGFVVLSFLSYPAMLFLPFLLYACNAKLDSQSSANDSQGTIRPKWPQCFLVVVAGVLVSVTNYVFFIAPNKSSALTGFFPEGFYSGRSVADFLEFYGARLSTLTGFFFFGGPGALRIAAIIIIAIGFIYLWAFKIKQSRLETFQTAILLTAPVAGIIVLNMVGVFPVPGFNHRLLLFVFPVTVLVFCLGLQFLVNQTSKFITYRFTGFQVSSVENVLGSVVFAGLLVLLSLFFSTVGLGPYVAEEYEDSEEAVAYLAQRIQVNDLLYIHATMREQFKLYSGIRPVATTNIVYGKIGMPCCPRKDYRAPGQESIRDIASEIFALSSAGAGGSLWLLVTDRPLHWFHVQRNDIEIFGRGLTSQGCKKIEEARFTGVYVGRFGCKPK
jgi:4-amino-4-deoxy-L-arabinose transferase-like glycosyltransferase